MIEKKIKKEYTNGEVTVIWLPHLCNHSSICLLKLPNVFRLHKRPWIDINAAQTAQIIDVVKQCPTLALDYYMNTEKVDGESIIGVKERSGIEFPSEDSSENLILQNEHFPMVEIFKNGPLLIREKIKIIYDKETSVTSEKATSFCRCGLSKKQPYCDGSHINQPFE
ncbi:MAG: (4Fe-4S)-binding protein [Bacteroidales bacterium]|nr:(4Fe-4S)-binding protein [Bacteroidales bacterium]